MASRSAKRSLQAPSSRRRTSMNLDKAKLRAVRRALGARTDTEAVDRALDTVLANSAINEAMDSIRGQFPDFPRG